MKIEFFNLHSTMLLLYRGNAKQYIAVHYLFTFHYASTLSLDPYLEGIAKENLHSTMLLLYLYRIGRNLGQEK